MKLEIWADSFHEGDWCCQQIAQALVNSFGFDKPSISYNMAFNQFILSERAMCPLA